MLNIFLMALLSFSTVWAGDITQYDLAYVNVPNIKVTLRGNKANTSEQQLKDACNSWLQKQLTLLNKGNSVILESRCSDIWTAPNDTGSFQITGLIYFK